MATKMGMGHTVKCVFRLTFLLKKAERSFHQKGKAADHSHSAVPSLTLPNIECSDNGLGPLFKETRMGDYNEDTFSDSDTNTNTDTDTDTSSVFTPDLAVRAQPADAEADAGSSSNHPHNGKRKRLVRIVSFKSIAHDRSRWSSSQERELAIAQHELARCQKAWSSEQELWLEYIKILLEEKEAHEEFLSHRAKQSGDEQGHFRKAWRSRRAGEEQRGRTRSRSGLRALRGSRSGKGRGE
ncbi:uncharacterized protein NFIA_064130 [Aspergillus fischeri NRRL 181]|uniref:Uncharacterized protein n=1 Tax=Neosartorya fischeri (strain ATCC 1020 / DSM 3700 / CBS 544.65 / FGSC A1164 / JCM 1740 / NRRL 181 / WB 181) TaxID=331117 RepID=A1D6A5_NEOFI|nr:conserved hypothetical protein [Aspergillus fischeri NRRL 181]EAW21249.1 conserved hypothetical protein [Aspergillus fischeri NRRL 181]KAG2014907.1 hypothetical protein GB937_006365 [Aspergillus fischeri]